MRNFLSLWVITLLMVTAVSAQTTINICAIRVDFQEDQNALTTGNGKFMVDSVTTEPFAIDPAPHNRTYFQDQIIAAANYFKNVSAGRVVISGDVFPSGLNDAYTLPNTMGFYNPNTTDEEINAGIAGLFRDAVELADQDETIHFADYNLVVVFHAGVGKDIDVGFDETPQDIPSLFLTEIFMKNTFGEEFTGIQVDEGNSPAVTRGILLPETENQEGFQIALTGIFASNIGSYLGMLDLFSPSTQRSGVGRFDLMDVGLLNLNGLVPAAPGAFTREYVGWSTPMIVDRPQNGIEISRYATDAPLRFPDIAKIPINDSEYYLLEYRGQYDVNIDSLFFELFEEKNEAPTYLEVLSTYYPDWIEISDSSGVLLSVKDYDIGLPGAGTLIWHVDERIIRARIDSSGINDDPENRAVDIEEADGSQDIGQLYNITQAGFQSELGTWLDFWFKHPDDEEIRPLYQNSFSTFTSPNSRSNLNNAVSHITIDNFSSNKSATMVFDFKRDYLQSGFPLDLESPGINSASAVFGEIEGKSHPYVFTLSSDGVLWCVGNDGKGLFDTEILRLQSFPAGAGVPSVALGKRVASDRFDLLVVAGDSLHVYDLQASVSLGMLSLLFEPVDIEDYAAGSVIFESEIIYVLDNNGVVNAFGLDGTVEKLMEDTNGFADFVVVNGLPESIQGAEYVAGFYTGNHATIIGYDSENRNFKIPEGKEFSPEQPLTGSFAIADVENNGYYNIVFNSANHIHALNVSGNPVSGFPISPLLSGGETLSGTPLLADLDGDGHSDILAVTTLGVVYAFDREGESIAGFPLNAGEMFSGTPVILNWDDDPELEIVAVVNSGRLYAWEIPGSGEETNSDWAQSNYNAGNNALVPVQLEPVSLGSGIMPDSRAYNYPNPNEGDFTTIRYYLNEEAEVTIRIFDTAGFTVDRFDGPGTAGVDNEVRWNVADIASGVYLCQIEAQGGSKKESTIIKIMVVH